MQNEIFLSVIIPVYNESSRIKETLGKIREYLLKQNYLSEIIAVNDGSTDDTGDLLKKFAKELPNLKIINLETNKGKGAAVREGMINSHGETCVFMDADSSTDIREIEKMLPFLRAGYGVMVGSRFVKNSSITTPQPTTRLLAGKIFRLICRTITPTGVIDTQNGFKMFRGNAAREIFREQTLRGWAFDVEILMIAKKLGYTIKEVPISWHHCDKSHTTLKTAAKMLVDLVRLKLRKNT